MINMWDKRKEERNEGAKKDEILGKGKDNKEKKKERKDNGGKKIKEIGENRKEENEKRKARMEVRDRKSVV